MPNCTGTETNVTMAVEEESESEDEGDLHALAEAEETKPIKDIVSGSKRKLGLADLTKSKRKVLSRSDEIGIAKYHKRAFGRAWMLLLSFPMSAAVHKLVLKHLPDFVVPNMSQPILLADYLTKSYDIGGVVSVLSLESLFVLIADHNLDYPQFFLSLYRLCTIEVFSAKYRTKFMKLLSIALKSTNLPAYTAAAYLKRLMHLSLHAPTPSAAFCITQAFRLLQTHPQCMALVHRGDESFETQLFLERENDNLEVCGALQSSLWEAEALLNHHFHGVADLAHKFKRSVSKAADIRKAPLFLSTDECIGFNYADLIADELTASKKNAALAYKRPTSLIPAGSITDQCFGF
jgi:U3 small nucleolar RNA-associated protein 19